MEKLNPPSLSLHRRLYKTVSVRSDRTLLELWRVDADQGVPDVQQINLVTVGDHGQESLVHRHPEASGLWETFGVIAGSLRVKWCDPDRMDVDGEALLLNGDTLTVPPGFWHQIISERNTIYVELRSKPFNFQPDEKEFK